MDPLTLIVLAVAGALGYSVLRQRQAEAAAVSQPATPPTAPSGLQLGGAALGGLVAGIATEAVGSWMEKREHARESKKIADQIDARVHAMMDAGEFDAQLASAATNYDIGTYLDFQIGPLDMRLKYAGKAGDEIVSSGHELYGLWGGEYYNIDVRNPNPFAASSAWLANALNVRRAKIEAEAAAQEAAEAARDAAVMEGATPDEAEDAAEAARAEALTPPPPPPAPAPPPPPVTVWSTSKDEESRWFSLR